ncbi:MAG: tetraacyldisaccharide 4'-kinase [Candidatus Poribacteria bacterium]|nr:tetraacyldisaccharide 4'-kinase [Candidatus Poribacteria bacterium]
MNYLQPIALRINAYVNNVITGRQKGPAPVLIQFVLTPMSWLYSVVVRVRNRLYSSGMLKVKRLPCPIISVGNIVAGGTGKTPTVIWIAKHLQTKGYPVAVLLRGYGRQYRSAMTVVSDGNQILGCVEECGDEAMMIARAVPGCIVIVGKNRYDAGCAAIRMMGVSTGVLILDDGFQHRRLYRGLDIVTVDSTQPLGSGKLLPAGTLRETNAALKRADVVLLTRTDQQLAPTFQSTRPAASKSAALEGIVDPDNFYESRHCPTALYELKSRQPIPLDWLSGKRILAVCGIGAPDAFAETLRQHGAAQVTLIAYPDHHRYRLDDYKQISAQFGEIGADMIVTTEKDAQRMAGFEGLRCFVLAVALEITKNQIGFSRRLMHAIRPTHS